MSVFLTSPRTTQDLVGFHAPSFSASRPLTSASLALPTSPVPSMGPLRISGATAPVGGSVLVGDKQETEGERVGELVEEEVRLPENLLEVSGSVEYSSEGEDDGSQTTGSGGDRESPMEHDGQGPLPLSHIHPHTHSLSLLAFTHSPPLSCFSLSLSLCSRTNPYGWEACHLCLLG